MNQEEELEVIKQENDQFSKLEEENEKKKSRDQSKKRSRNWSRQETLSLIRIRGQLDERFKHGGSRKTKLWEEISSFLHKENVCRDTQQCRDKWEKLSSAYKLKKPSENPFFQELRPIFSQSSATTGDKHCQDKPSSSSNDKDEETEEDDNLKKRVCSYHVEEVLRPFIDGQEQFFRQVFEEIEVKKDLRDHIRMQKEEQWRDQERKEMFVLSNSLILLTSELQRQKHQYQYHHPKEEKLERFIGSCSVTKDLEAANCSKTMKRRSKNWKTWEVVKLITLRKELESLFVGSSRRAESWEEVSRRLGIQGVYRDGKQCREKWDKLLCEYKDVVECRKSESLCPYFQELSSVLGHGRKLTRKTDDGVRHDCEEESLQIAEEGAEREPLAIKGQGKQDHQ